MPKLQGIQGVLSYRCLSICHLNATYFNTTIPCFDSAVFQAITFCSKKQLCSSIPPSLVAQSCENWLIAIISADFNCTSQSIRLPSKVAALTSRIPKTANRLHVNT